MNDKKLRILAGLERIADEDGCARIDDLSKATGISNRAINNSLRYLRPEYITIEGQAEMTLCDGGGSPPKILRITEKGREIGEDHSVEMTDDQIAEMWSDIHNLQARVTEVEESNAKLVRENRRLREYIFDHLDEL